MENLQDLFTMQNGWSTQLLQAIVVFLPKLVFAIIVWVIGRFLAKAVRSGVMFIADKIGLQMISEKTGIAMFLKRANWKSNLGGLIADIFYWIIYLIGLNVAFDVIGLDVVSNLISELITYIPNLFVAVILIVIGSYAARFVKDITDAAVASTKVNSDWVGHVAYIVVMVLAIITALKQAKIDISFLTQNINTVMMGIMLALGLAFGLGGKDKAQEMIEKYLK